MTTTITTTPRNSQTEHATRPWPTRGRDALRAALTPFASLRLTVVLLGLSMLLIFFGTLAQTSNGIWWVMDQYFTSWWVMVPLGIFAGPGKTIPGSFPFPGGATLGLAVLINLLAAHGLRFKLRARGWRLVCGLLVLLIGTSIIIWFQSWGVIGPLKGAIGVAGMLLAGLVAYTPAILGTALLFGKRVGIVLIHSSLVLLIVGEAVTRTSALEMQMPIYEGQTLHWAQDVREAELAVIAPRAAADTTERVTAIPAELLQQAAVTGQPIIHDSFPFAIRVEQYFANSAMAPYRDGVAPPRGARGIAQSLGLIPRPHATGVGDAQLDLPGAWLTIFNDDQPLGRYAVSAFTMLLGDVHRTQRQEVPIGDDVWQIDLRFKRYYHDYGFELTDFTHDLYPGTNVPLNYASDIRIFEPDAPAGRAVNIRMNQPLRFAGHTFFQSGYIQDPFGGTDLGTVLQVVRNPGSTMPYIACALGGVGLLVHFVLSLWKYTARSASGGRP